MRLTKLHLLMRGALEKGIVQKINGSYIYGLEPNQLELIQDDQARADAGERLYNQLIAKG